MINEHGVYPDPVKVAAILKFPAPQKSVLKGVLASTSGSIVAKALYYQLEDHGFENRWGEFIFQFTYYFLPH
jgi:hypothetical protein